MTTQQYWISKTVIVDWVLTDPTTGVFIPDATVVGTVTLPNGTTAAMLVTELSDRYRATYDPAGAGLHAYRLAATGAADDAEEGTFIVRPSLAGAATITTDPTTNIGVVRLLITDVDPGDPLFTDAQITGFLTLEGDNIRLAAAQALDTMARSEVLISKVIRTQDLQTDGSKVAAELRASAASLREQAAERNNDGTATAFEVVDFDPLAWLTFADELTE